MSHTFINSLHHCVFSTKARRSMLTPALQSRLFSYMGGIARENKIKLLAAGGIDDHVHLLISIPSTISISKTMQLIKGGSSKWIHETFEEHRLFEWQEGYGAFSIGISDVERTVNYINNQAEHHGKMDFKTEFRAFLKKQEIEYDERYIFD
ncbi:MAG TPA: IS200/IS605 family transposase [Pyrinomonadaceae bacterium]|nr:IS200/IS605 family transposase [Pyrinomonadaceae bacterium]